eukprot:2721812-Prymnesium_polylepis.1
MRLVECGVIRERERGRAQCRRNCDRPHPQSIRRWVQPQPLGAKEADQDVLIGVVVHGRHIAAATKIGVDARVDLGPKAGAKLPPGQRGGVVYVGAAHALPGGVSQGTRRLLAVGAKSGTCG